MTDTLERVTTEYIESEDRLRLSGETASRSSVVIWLTSRLLQKLVPILLQWLEQQHGATPRAGILHEWAQQAARAGLAAQPPVKTEGAHKAWLAQSIDITPSTETVVLTFRSGDEQRAVLVLAAEPLRQWLNIAYDAHVVAGWSLAVWPEWVSEAAVPIQAPRIGLH